MDYLTKPGSPQEVLDELTHHGVLGMKWGVRKDPKPLGFGNPKKTSTARTLATNATDRRIELHKKARDGKGVIGKVALADKHTWGRKGRFEKYHNNRITQLEETKKRINKGEKVARTLVFGPQYTNVKASSLRRPH